MDYQGFLKAVQGLDFVPDFQTADALVKAVLGIFASSLTEPAARELTEALPEPLDYERLRGHQARPLAITADRYRKAIMAQFGLGEEQAQKAVALVLTLTRNTLPNKEIRDIIYTLKFEVVAGKA